MKLCFVVHRYAPFPGGSEYYVQQLAEECVKRNHDVTVFAGEHKGDLNNVHVTSDPNCLMNNDLVIVHGGDVNVQNFVLSNIRNINGPVLYMLIKPSENPICLQGLFDATYIGCSTIEDWNHVKKWKVFKKARTVVHGISSTDCLGIQGEFKKKYNIPKNKTMFLSCGGYWPHKRHRELAEVFIKANLNNAILVTTGYNNDPNSIPRISENVISLLIEDAKDVKNAIADADCYIMNSETEGFGLVILEAMYNKTPWIARKIAGARLLADYGTVYEKEDELCELIKTFSPNKNIIENAYNMVKGCYMIENTVDDILNIINNTIR